MDGRGPALQQFPDHYSVVAKADTQGDVALEGARLPLIPSAPPTEFGGPGDRWSPETLFVASVADCFVLTFRGIAGVSRFPWVSLECNVTGTVTSIASRSSRHSRSVRVSGCRQAQTRIRRDGCWPRLKRRASSRTPSRFSRTCSLPSNSKNRENRHLRVCAIPVARSWAPMYSEPVARR